MTGREEDEERLLRSVTLQNANSILLARQRAEEELIRANDALEHRTVELAHSLAMMRATLESTTDAILVTDGGGKVTGFNQRYVDVWGVSRDAVESRDHRRLLHEASQRFADPRRFLARVDEIYATAPPETFDVLELADGRVVERSSRIQYVDERNVGRVWGFRDVTERKRAEESLRDETRILELLNRTGTAIASQLELQALVQTVTDAATELSGARFGAFFYTTRDAKGDAFLLYTLCGAPREAFEKFGHPRATPLFGPTFLGQGPIRCDDVLADPRYGQMPPHSGMPAGHLPVRSYMAVPVISRTGEVLGGLFFGHPEIGVFTARTQRVIVGVAGQAAVAIDNSRFFDAAKRSAEERTQLLEAERTARAEAERVSHMKDEFLATLSHELRTPLNAILGWSTILRGGADNPDDLQQGLETIERNARAQTQIIEDLLDMSRIISGKVRLDVQLVELSAVAQAAIDSIRPAADAKGIRVNAVLDPGAGPVSGDPNRLQQVMWNLLTNAVKFTPRGGRVQVLLKRINSHLELSVVDTGEGIRPEFLPHVFDRFRQADASTTRRHGGLGLGLAIVKQLVELHGGTILAQSGGEGAGTTFTIALPLTPIHPERDPHRERRHPQGRAPVPLSPDACADIAGVKLLVVDDEPDSRQLIQRFLEDCHAVVTTASSVSDALAHVARECPDVLVSDIGMPGEDGYTLIRRLRSDADARCRNVPAIALTAYARAEDRVKALMAGFQMHVAKPVEPAELIAMIASLCRSRNR